MGMGLYGGEKIKRLTRERERERKRIFKNNSHYKLLAPFNGSHYTQFHKTILIAGIKSLFSSIFNILTSLTQTAKLGICLAKICTVATQVTALR
ncbi:hypothetical protein VN0294_12830 [Helicobacter pylori]